MIYALFVYTFSVNGYTTQNTFYQTESDCNQALQTMTIELDRLNEAEILGYSIKCNPTNINHHI